MLNVIIAVKHLPKGKRFLKIIDRGPYLVGFPAMWIMDLWGMLFHSGNVLPLIFALSFKSCSALCGLVSLNRALCSGYLDPDINYPDLIDNELSRFDPDGITSGLFK